MPITIKSSRMQYRKSNGDYVGVDAVSERKTSEYVSDIESTGSATQSAIEQTASTARDAIDTKAQQARDSIPSDYTTLSDDVSDLKSAINQSVTTDAKIFSKVAEHKSIELPITWVQGVWGASGASDISTRIRSSNLYTHDEEITFKIRNAGTGTIAYTKYSDNGHTRVDTGYVSNSITLDAGYYYGFWMQASNQASDILPSAGDAVSFCFGMTNGHAVFIGDSYTEGVGLDSSSDRWSTKVCVSLGLTEHNYAVGGTGFYVGNNNNTDFIHQASNAINDTSFRNVDVKYVFIAGGRNDGSNSTAMTYSQSQVQSLVSALIDGVQSNFPNATIILIPMMFDADIIPQYIFSWYQKIILSCRSFYRNVRIVKGAYTWLTGSFGFIQNDGIHPNSAGHNVIATNVIDCLNGGDGQNNIGTYTIAYNQSAINNNPTMGVICDGKRVFLQSSLIRTTGTVSAGTPLFTETYNTTFIIGWCKPQKIYFTINNTENGQSYSVYFIMSKTSTSYTASLIANESIPLGKYSLYGEYDFGRYLNVATGN